MLKASISQLTGNTDYTGANNTKMSANGFDPTFKTNGEAKIREADEDEYRRHQHIGNGEVGDGNNSDKQTKLVGVSQKMRSKAHSVSEMRDEFDISMMYRKLGMDIKWAKDHLSTLHKKIENDMTEDRRNINTLKQDLKMVTKKIEEIEKNVQEFNTKKSKVSDLTIFLKVTNYLAREDKFDGDEVRYKIFKRKLQRVFDVFPSLESWEKFEILYMCVSNDIRSKIKQHGEFLNYSFERAMEYLDREYDPYEDVILMYRHLNDIGSLNVYSLDKLRETYKYIKMCKVVHTDEVHNSVVGMIVGCLFDNDLISRWCDYRWNAETEGNQINCIDLMLHFLLESIDRAEDLRPFEENLQNKKECFVCEDNHQLDECEELKNKSLIERMKLAEQSGACLNCLNKDHYVEYCKHDGCRICGKRLHPILHICENEESLP